MNPHEGLTRIAQVIRWLGYGFAVVVVLGGFAIAATAGSETVVVGVASIVCGALVAGAGWAIAWIIDGFAKPRA